VLLGQPDICSPGAIVGFAALRSGGAWTAVGFVTLVALIYPLCGSIMGVDPGGATGVALSGIDR
jgi:uncharacterized membrane protein